MKEKYNLTNPNSIYIKVGIKLKGFREFHVHAFIDTGASMCIATKHIFPDKFWKSSERKPLIAKIANGEKIRIDKQIENQEINIQGMKFIIEKIYQLESGVDLILGNNFLLKYSPFIQTDDKIVLTKDLSLIHIPKVTQAMKVGNPDFLINFKKSKTPLIENITYIHNEEDIIDMLFYKCQEEEEIADIFEQICSDNPQDKVIKRKKFNAIIELKNPEDTIDLPPRRVNQEDTQIFKLEIEKLLQIGIIEQSKGRHSSPAFYVTKKGTTDKRLVIDYREVNLKTKMDAYKIPNKEDLLSYIGGNKYFSCIDCKSGFWQIQLHSTSKELTAFSCPQGLYQWNVLPFGLKQAPGIFQRYIF